MTGLSAGVARRHELLAGRSDMTDLDDVHAAEVVLAFAAEVNLLGGRGRIRYPW